MTGLVESWISKAAAGAARMQAPKCQVDSVDFKLRGGEMHFKVSGVEIGNLAPYKSDWLLRMRNVNFVVSLTIFMRSGLDQLVIEELTVDGLEVTVEKTRDPATDNVEEFLGKIPHNGARGSCPNEGNLLIKKMQAERMIVHLVLAIPDDEPPLSLAFLAPLHDITNIESHGATKADDMIQLLLKKILGSASRVVPDPAKDGGARSTYSNAGAFNGSTLHGIMQYSLDSLCFFSADALCFFHRWLPSFPSK